MERMTFSVPDSLKRRMDARPDINWPQVFKEGIIKRVEEFERLK
jgi:hypothetical protein